MHATGFVRSHHSQELKYMIFKSQNKMRAYFKFMRPHKLHKNTLTLILWILQFVRSH